MIGVRLYPDIEAALEAWIEQQPEPRLSKPKAIRRILRDALGLIDDAGSSTRSV